MECSAPHTQKVNLKLLFLVSSVHRNWKSLKVKEKKKTLLNLLPVVYKQAIMPRRGKTVKSYFGSHAR